MCHTVLYVFISFSICFSICRHFLSFEWTVPWAEKNNLLNFVVFVLSSEISKTRFFFVIIVPKSIVASNVITSLKYCNNVLNIFVYCSFKLNLIISNKLKYNG